MPNNGGSGNKDMAPAVVCSHGEVACGNQCTYLDDDVHNCGSCNNDCTKLPHVYSPEVTCSEGACQSNSGYDACTDNYLDCNGDLTDGCEVNGLTGSNCGKCGAKCPADTPVCTTSFSLGEIVFGCVSACSSPTPNVCGSSCVNTSNDPANCGDCDNDCGTPAHGTVECANWECNYTCNAGYVLCDSGKDCCPQWDTSVVAPLLGGGKAGVASFALGSDGAEYVVYSSANTQELIYAKATATGSYTLEHIAGPFLPSQTIATVSIGVDSAGKVHGVYSLQAATGATSNLRAMHYVERGSSGWLDEVVDDADVYAPLLAVTPAGVCHILVDKRTAGKLRHGVRTGPGAYTWEDVYTGTAESPFGFALAKDGTPRVAFSDSNEMIHYGTPGASGWTIETVGIKASAIGFSLDPNDHPYIVYNDYMTLKETHKLVGFWETLSFATAHPGTPTPIRFDSKGTPTIATVVTLGTYPTYTAVYDFEYFATQWTAITPTPALPTGAIGFTDYAIDAKDHAHYLIGITGGIGLSTGSVGGAIPTPIDTLSDPGRTTRMLTDTNGTVHLIYGDAARNTTYATYAYASGKWTSETLPFASGSFALALDANNIPHVCTVSSMNVVYYNRLGGKWNSEVAATAPALAYACALALDSNNHPHIAFTYEGPYSYSGTTYLTKYARKTGAAWEPFDVDDMNYGTNPSVQIALDASGAPHVVYDAGTGPLHVGHWDGTRFELQSLSTSATQIGDGFWIDGSGVEHLLLLDGGVSYATLDGATFSSNQVNTGEVTSAVMLHDGATAIVVYAMDTAYFGAIESFAVARQAAGATTWEISNGEQVPSTLTVTSATLVNGKVQAATYDTALPQLRMVREP